MPINDLGANIYFPLISSLNIFVYDDAYGGEKHLFLLFITIILTNLLVSKEFDIEFDL